MKWAGDFGVWFIAPRVGEESESEGNNGKSDGCDCPVLLGPPSPP